MFITFINMLIKGLSCGRFKLTLDSLNPYYICKKKRNFFSSKKSSKYEPEQVSKAKKEMESSIIDKKHVSKSKEQKNLRKDLENLNEEIKRAKELNAKAGDEDDIDEQKEILISAVSDKFTSL